MFINRDYWNKKKLIPVSSPGELLIIDSPILPEDSFRLLSSLTLVL